jgi:hypothetical protein
MEVYDLLGKMINVLDGRMLDPGTYSTTWDATRHEEGTYLLKLTTEKSTAVRKIILIR